MNFGPLLGLLFAFAFALAFWEYRAVHDLNPSAMRTALRMFMARGVVPQKYSGVLTAPSGFKLRPLGSGAYLVRTLEWNERGSEAGALMPWAFALVRTQGREWTLDARFGSGVIAAFAASIGVFLALAVRNHFTPGGWAAVLGWSGCVLLSFLIQRQRMRRAFSRFTVAVSLTSGV